MFGPTFGKTAAEIQAMGLSSDPFEAQKQIATGNYNPNATAPISNTATVGTSGMTGGMRMTDADVSKIFADMKSGVMDAKTGALKLSQGQVNLYDMARISGQSPEAIQAAAAQNGIRIQDSLGQNGVIQQGGLLQGMSMADAAKSQGGEWVDRNAGTGQKPAWEYQGPQGVSFGMDLSRMTMGGPPSQTTVNNWADTARNDLYANGISTGYNGSTNYASGNQPPTVNWQSMPSNSIAGYGNQGMFGGTSPSRTPYTSYKPYQPYQGQNRTSGMFGAPTMNYNQANSPWAGNQQQTGWSQTNPWSTARGL